jgi:hypothetical protein
MPDVWHVWGADLRLGPTGDLLGVTGSEAVRQRVLRRILSNPGDLMFTPDYGAGLPAKVGSLLDRDALSGAVRQQISAEAAVSRDPPAEVTATPFPHGVSVVIRYRDAVTGEAAQLGFDVDR